MAGDKWSPKQIEKVKEAVKNKPEWMTDNELAGRLVAPLKKTKEAVRWQIRQLRVDKVIGVSYPKILLMDIETLPIEAYVWGGNKQYIGPKSIKKDWSIVCWSAKWLFDNKPFGQVVSPQEAVDRQDGSVMEKIWNAFNEANIVIAHNGNGFDFKRLNTRFLVNGYPKPMYYKSIDTLEVLRKEFDFTFNKMDYVNSVLGIGRKIETEFDWWTECSEGNKKYLAKMLEYNLQDVHVLEELYLKIRPWITGHPNVSLFNVDNDVPGCPACGSLDLAWGGEYMTGLGLYAGFRCQSCGSIGRSTRKQYKIGASKVQN